MSGDYYKTKESVKEYIKLAEGYDGSHMIDVLKDLLIINSDLLEIGSGPGTDWSILNRFFNVVGSDNSIEFLNHLKSHYPNAKFLELDAITLTTELRFDGIYSNKVLHHLSDNELKTSIQRQYEILKPEGVICHSFWNGEGSEVYNGLLVNYHTMEDLRKLFTGFFNVLAIEYYNEFEKDDSIFLIGKIE